MPQKPLTAGGEVDSYCTKCRMVLNHRVIAMVNRVPRKVECSTCGSHHLFRARPPGEKPEPGAKPLRGEKPGISAPRPTRTTTASRARAIAETREKNWEQAVLGKQVSDFTRYNVTQSFSEGQLVKHSKFGDGVVTRVLDRAKVEITFRDETRTLAQNHTV
jgi:hypothetical protein